jgi:NitT/TauT family transport system permease protein
VTKNSLLKKKLAWPRLVGRIISALFSPLRSALRFVFRTFSVTRKPGKWSARIIPWLLFAGVVVFYIGASYERHKNNPDDRMVPTGMQIIDGVKRMVYAPDTSENNDSVKALIGNPSNFSGKITQFKVSFYRAFHDKNNPDRWFNSSNKEMILLVDTLVSTKRFLISLGIIFIISLFIGLLMRIPLVELFLQRFILFFDKMNPIVLTPILFIFFGSDELFKIVLIVIAVIPGLILDTHLKVKAYPSELITKSMTLGAGTFGIIFRTILPKIFPEFLDSLRLKFKDIITFLMVGETISAVAGLGYRIFLMKRWIAMDIIIPYVIWASFLTFVADCLIRTWIKKKYPWVNK